MVRGGGLRVWGEGWPCDSSSWKIRDGSVGNELETADLISSHFISSHLISSHLISSHLNIYGYGEVCVPCSGCWGTIGQAGCEARGAARLRVDEYLQGGEASGAHDWVRGGDLVAGFGITGSLDRGARWLCGGQGPGDMFVGGGEAPIYPRVTGRRVTGRRETGRRETGRTASRTLGILDPRPSPINPKSSTPDTKR